MKNDYLVHYGTKGQKWGVRKYQYEDGTYTPAGKERYFDSDGDSRGRAGRALAVGGTAAAGVGATIGLAVKKGASLARTKYSGLANSEKMLKTGLRNAEDIAKFGGEAAGAAAKKMKREAYRSALIDNHAFRNQSGSYGLGKQLEKYGSAGNYVKSGKTMYDKLTNTKTLIRESLSTPEAQRIIKIGAAALAAAGIAYGAYRGVKAIRDKKRKKKEEK